MKLKNQTDHATQTNFNSAREETICTLYEKDYHYGLAALINSLVNNGYNGTVWIGYRDQLPPWINQLKADAPVKAGDEFIPSYLVENKIRLVFLHTDPPWHLTNYKPLFMLEIFSRYATDCQYLWYFDPDIFLVNSWKYFQRWQHHGIALCGDINFDVLPDNAPIRCEWKEFAKKIGLTEANSLDQYFNGGLVSVARSQIEFIELWEKILKGMEDFGIPLNQFMPGDREHPFCATDQDALNVAAMYTRVPLSPQGRWAMGFEPGGAVMYHTVGPKPWRGTLLRALKGHTPSNGARYYFKQAAGPIRPYSSIQLYLRRLACSLASFIGRFYNRSLN